MKKFLITIPFLFLAAACNNQQAQVQSAQNQQTQASLSTPNAGGSFPLSQGVKNQIAQEKSDEAKFVTISQDTYINTKYGFKFTFPKNYCVNSVADTVYSPESLDIDSTCPSYGDKSTTIVRIGLTTSTGTLENYLKDKSIGVSTAKKVTIAGMNGYKEELTEAGIQDNQSPLGVGYLFHYYLKNNTNNTIFTIDGYDQAVANTILPTLQLTK